MSAEPPLKSLICRAIESQVVLELRYHRFSRLVEPYVLGVNKSGAELLRCYQIAGGSVGGDRRGWKLLKVAEIATVHLTQTTFGPRAQYQPDDVAMAHLYCRVQPIEYEQVGGGEPGHDVPF